MKKIYTKIYFILVLALLSTVLFAQEQLAIRESADKLYNKMEFARAAILYQKLAEGKKSTQYDVEQLADCYWRVRNYDFAAKWYHVLSNMQNAKTETFFKYALVLKTQGKYQEAKNYFNEYSRKAGSNKRVVDEKASCDSALNWLSNPTTHQILNEKALNTERSDFSVFPHGNTLYYTSETSSSTIKQTYGWTGKGYLNIFTALKGNNNYIDNVKLFNNEINKEKFHSGSLITNRNGDKLFVTRTYNGKQTDLRRNGNTAHYTNNLALYIYQKDKKTWLETPFQHNNTSKWSVGHAALSTDEKTLYFVSDQPGGLGGTDIWFSELQSDGTWGTPQNAGSIINTSGNELFPHIAADGTMYYATDGLPGMGGLDIFSAVGAKNLWQTPSNMRYPINSSADDFAFYLETSNKEAVRGYLSSNRTGGVGNDDIYSFSYQEPKLIFAVQGDVYQKLNKEEELNNAVVTLQNLTTGIKTTKYSKADNGFFFELDKGTEYSITASLENFNSDTQKISTKNIRNSDTLEIALYLEPVFAVGKTYSLNNIHYDYDKFDIKPDAAKLLDNLATILKENPSLKIELASHTDSRGKDDYNISLSQKRAQSALDYLINQGIAADRMTSKGYGETQLLNRCTNNAKCSEKEHALNRRTEFTVVEF